MYIVVDKSFNAVYIFAASIGTNLVNDAQLNGHVVEPTLTKVVVTVSVGDYH